MLRPAARGHNRRDREVEAGWRWRPDLSVGHSILEWAPRLGSGGEVPSRDGMKMRFSLWRKEAKGNLLGKISSPV
jgi:hypothetical protein